MYDNDNEMYDNEYWISIDINLRKEHYGQKYY